VSARQRHLILALIAAVAVLAPPAAQARSPHLTVSVQGAVRRVPSSFLGISVETYELTRWEQWSNYFGRMLDVLQPRGHRSQVMLRVGGESADSSFWGNNWQQDVQPAYYQGHPYIIDQSWMDGLAALVREARLKVLLDLNLASHSPKMAAEEASSARSTLPRRSLSAFEVGDEPDLYSRGLVGTTQAEHGGPNEWAFTFSPSDYDTLFAKYAVAVRQVFPGANMAGPSVTSASYSWPTSLINSQPQALSLVTVHSYPRFDGCPRPGDPPPPQASGYLKDAAAAGVARTEKPILASARVAHLPVRVDEAGSASCGGKDGQSNTFATALWAPDFVFNMLATGVSGMNIHLRANGFPNTAIQYTNSGLLAEPFFYGLAMFARTLGPGAKLMNVTRSGGLKLLKVWPVRLSDGTLRVLYINKSRSNAAVKLRWSSRRAGSLQRLTAPSLLAENTVKLAGQRLGLNGRWQGTRHVGRVPVHKHIYRVSVPALSAALLSIPG
jgi:hypothetical protein